MDDTNVFERLVADEMQRRAGPDPVVNDAAIFDAVTTATQSPKWRFSSMFSATKFLVAGATVALFGGFLLAGVMTGPSDDRLPAVGASASATTRAEPTDAATSGPEPTTVEEADTSTAVPDLLPGVDLATEEVAPGVYRVIGDGIRDELVNVSDAKTAVADRCGRVPMAACTGSARRARSRPVPADRRSR